MKIGLVLDDTLDKPDGVQQYVLTIGHWFGLQGHEVHYLVGQSRRRDIPNVHSMSRNVNVSFNQNRMSVPLPAGKQNIRTLLKREQFDVLHVQMPYSPMLAAKIIRAAAPTTAVIGSFHIVPFSSLERVATRLLRTWLRKSVRRFDTIVSVSEPAARFAAKSFRVGSHVIPNAVNTGLFSHGKRYEKFNDGKINIVFLGRLVERKGCMYLLEAINYLHSQHPLINVRVVVCGKGPLETELKQYVKSHRLGSIVHFAGFVSEKEKPHMLASAHIAAFPSTGGESFGIVLVEAMASGAEVVLGGDNEGYMSVLGERADQIVSPLDTEAFARQLKHFISNGRARKRAKSWQQKQLETYDVRTVGEQLLDIYREAFANRKANGDNNDQ